MSTQESKVTRGSGHGGTPAADLSPVAAGSASAPTPAAPDPPSRASTVRRVLALSGVVLRYGLPLLLSRRWRRMPGPVRLRRALETLGGGWIKLGQLLALRFDLLPAAYCVELFNLLNRLAPFPYAEVERIVREELGR